ncbi:PREDICTED: general odorant-binding protein 56d [Polistes canadensis]|uniref:general odorant-binding protein 56d n=1 Tax=Polistes canadensis TaxID=91411 RepID=UPI000718E870|nr:PREDICTED: general odorant-binding protein 56d [Polistes canadensis]
MKAAIIFVILIVVLANFHDAESKKMSMEQIRTAIKSARKTCANQVGASKELLDNASQKGEFPPDPKLQCYFRCIMTLSKAMRNDEFRPDVMKTQAELMLTEDLSERIKETIDKCYPSITSSEPCEAAWQFAKCYYETDSSIYFIP